MHVHIGRSDREDRAKIKLVLDPPSAGQISPIVATSVQCALASVRQLVQAHPSTDRGHKHSSGVSEVCIWVSYLRRSGTDDMPPPPAPPLLPNDVTTKAEDRPGSSSAIQGDVASTCGSPVVAGHDATSLGDPWWQGSDPWAQPAKRPRKDGGVKLEHVASDSACGASSSDAAQSGRHCFDSMKQELLQQRDMEIGRVLSECLEKQVAALFATLREKIRTWPPVTDMSETEGVQAIQQMVLTSLFDGFDFSAYSASQIEAAKEATTSSIQGHLQMWRDESSLDTWLESE